MHDYQKRRTSELKLGELFSHRENVRVIHYSCESFSDEATRKSARVTGIAV